MSTTLTRGLQKVPNLILSDWVKANYNLPEVPIGDISWNRWYNDDWDITIYFEELNSPISAATIDSSIDLLESIVRIHVFVRDTTVHSDSSPLGDMIDMPFADIDFAINIPSRMALIVQYLNNLIDANTVSLKSEGVMLMDVQEAFEIPNTNWDESVYHWVIPVSMTYTEWSGGVRHFFRTFTENVTVNDRPFLPTMFQRAFSDNIGIPSSSMTADVRPGRGFIETVTVSDTPSAPFNMFALPPAHNHIIVNSLPALFTAVQNASNDDWIELVNGTYNNPSRAILTTSASRVVVKAQNLLGVIITGAPIDILSPGIIFYGFDLQYSITGDYIFINGEDSRFARNKVRLADVSPAQEWLTVLANNVLVDHNDFGVKSNNGTFTLIGTGDSLWTDCKILWNYYHDRPILNTPAEAIRIGSSESAQLEFNAEVAWNRFEQINGETELCTFKGSKIDCHHNTAINCNSAFTFRHGNFNKFNDNFLVNAGFRMNGHGHEVRRNQMLDNIHNQIRQALVIASGTDLNDAGSPGVAGPPNEFHSQVRDSIVERNIIVADQSTNLIHLSIGYTANEITFPPTFQPIDNDITDNIVWVGKGTAANTFFSANWNANRVEGNILFVHGTGILGDMPISGYRNIDPQLIQNVDLSYSFTGPSPMKWEQSIRVLGISDVGPLSI